jgi:hypothetical protein
MSGRLQAWVVLQADQGPELVKLALSKVFTFAMIWGLGGNLVHSKHDEFDQVLRNTIGNACQIPSAGKVFDVFVDVSSDPVELRCWNDHVPAFSYDKTASFHSMFVPTVDTCRCAVQLMQMTALFLFQGDQVHMCLHTGSPACSLQ